MALRKKRQSVDPEQAADPTAVRRAAVALLARRDFGTAELRARLQEQGFEAAVVESAVAELVEGRVLDDARYVENFVSYHADRGQGPLRIAADLRSLGIADPVIDAALAGPDWPALAGEARTRKFGVQRPTDWTGRARQARFLQYRGFSADHIRLALGTDFEAD